MELTDLNHSNWVILRQQGLQSVETRMALAYSMIRDCKVINCTMEQLAQNAALLTGENTVPLGSVEFIREAMRVAQIKEPANLAYPTVLDGHLHRAIKETTAGQVSPTCFVKPQKIKSFTGFVLEPQHLMRSASAHDQEQLEAFLRCEKSDPVWVSEPVKWDSEYRYYVLNQQIIGHARYDDGDDNAPTPDDTVVHEMLALMNTAGAGPAAYTIDAGVLSTGQTALIECNDAWALGFYKGTLRQADYFEMLITRWKELKNGRCQ